MSFPLNFSCRICVVAAGLFFSFNIASAQIIYVAPQANIFVPPFQTLNLDLDNNGVDELSFYPYIGHISNQYWQHAINIVPLSNDTNAIAGDTTNYYIVVTQFENGDTIDSATNAWNDRNTSPQHSIPEAGYGVDGNSGYTESSLASYLGIRFLIGTEIHYGWIGVYVGSSCIRIVDWAYNTQADSSIIIGQQTVGISPVQQQSTSAIFAADQSVIVQLKEISNATITVYNSLGQTINRTMNANGETKIGMENSPAGIYFVEVTEGNKTCSKKIYLQ
jgi:hypothetical protein